MCTVVVVDALADLVLKWISMAIYLDICKQPVFFTLDCIECIADIGMHFKSPKLFNVLFVCTVKINRPCTYVM